MAAATCNVQLYILPLLLAVPLLGDVVEAFYQSPPRLGPDYGHSGHHPAPSASAAPPHVRSTGTSRPAPSRTSPRPTSMQLEFGRNPAMVSPRCPRAGHERSPGRRFDQSLAGSSHDVPHAPGHRIQLQKHHRARRPANITPGCWRFSPPSRRVCHARPSPVLHLLRADARAHVFHHRHLGRTPAPPGRRQVFPLHFRQYLHPRGHYFSWAARRTVAVQTVMRTSSISPRPKLPTPTSVSGFCWD